MPLFVTAASPQVQQQILGEWKPAQRREVERAAWESGYGVGGLGMAEEEFYDPVSGWTASQGYQPPTPPNIPWSGDIAPLPEAFSAVSPDIMRQIAATKPPGKIEAWLLENKTIAFAVVAGIVGFALIRR